MGKHLKNESSSPNHGKYNHKLGWLAGMLHVLDFHHWRTKNRPICWKTPRTHSLMRETEEQEPFLDSKINDSKMLSVVADNKPTRPETKLKKTMTTKQVTEYVDFLEILRKEDVFVKIMKDQVQIKSNPRVLPKSGSFPISGSSRPARIQHKQKENWYAPKQNGAVLTLKVPRDTSQECKPISPSHGSADDDHGFNHAIINGFREIKKLLKNTLKDRNRTKKKKKKKVLDVAKDDYVGRYSQLLKQISRREGGDLRSKSLKLSYEEKKSDSRDNKPQFFRRISSLSSLEVLGSFLTDLPRDSSTSNQETRISEDQDTNFGAKKSVLSSESPVRAEKEEKYEVQEERSQENHLDSSNQRILQQEPDSVPSTNKTAEKTETLLPQGKLLNKLSSSLFDERKVLNSMVACSTGLGLSSLEIYKHEEEDEDAYFCYVKKVLKVSGFLENKDNEEKWYSEEQPLNPSLLYELDIQEEETVNDKELLFDLVNEAIVETQNHSQIYFPKTFPYGKRYLDEVWGRVEWSLSGLGAENRDRSLDDIVGRDLLTKSDGWMNLQGESEWLTLELEDLIFDDVLDELLCVY
ncbi:GTP-binding protein Obg/CgtA [Arabidopsis thaliana]|uniref:GTP-binding protein Obg/CgtA n=1 Tax=Arabidopsis thaliana TaxID=3702 RepID=A0A1P8AVB8_ARATH|nr:GTP-binding protein Obg/CgtA [Arabidopsis thaliana]ANM60582.1 GTP-binding protein Obg/CgtA [Arabidopsis thaliana]|eukprot:NP_001322859.1 GTP-binding protein Obg/CgtA [Arabidopsis thaliana]